MMFKLYAVVFIVNFINVCSYPPPPEEQEPSETEKWQTKFMKREKIEDLADKAYNKKLYTKAIFYYSKALEKESPKQSYYYMKRGYCNAKLGNDEPALQDLNKAHDISLKSEDKEPLPDGRVLFCEIESAYTDSTELANYGLILCREKKYKEALSCYNKAIDKAKASWKKSWAYGARAECSHQMGRLTEAIEDFVSAMLVNNGSMDYSLKRNYANTLLDSERYREAIEVMASTNTKYAIEDMAKKLHNMGKFQELLLLYTEAIVNDPKGIYYKLRGNCYTKLGNLEAALEDFEKAVIKNQNDRSGANKTNECSRGLLCSALLECGKTEEAVQEMQNLNASQLTSLGDTLFSQKRSSDALLCYSEAIRLYPKNAQCYEKRGIYYRKIDDLKNAKSDLEKAVEIEPSCLSCLIELGEVQITNREHADAKRIFQGLDTDDAFYKEKIEAALLTIEKAEEKARLESLKNHK